MATEHHILPLSYPASGDIRTAQYKFATLNSDRQLAVCDATVPVLGVLQDDPRAQYDPGNVCIIGESRLRVNASTTAIMPMDRLAPDANGFGVKTTLDNDEIGAIALEAANADGVIISVLVVAGLRA